MVLRYDAMSSTLKVNIIGEVTISGATEIGVINLEASPYDHGLHAVMLVIQNVSLSGDLTITVKGNTATDGSGTDTTIRTIVLDSADDELTVELPNELLGHFSDRASGYFKSIVFDAAGTDSDTFEAVTVARVMECEEGLTPSDTTSES